MFLWLSKSFLCNLEWFQPLIKIVKWTFFGRNKSFLQVIGITWFYTCTYTLPYFVILPYIHIQMTMGVLGDRLSIQYVESATWPCAIKSSHAYTLHNTLITCVAHTFTDHGWPGGIFERGTLQYAFWSVLPSKCAAIPPTYICSLSLT